MKKKPENKYYVDRFNESVTDWQQPTELDLLPIKQTYSPIGTPPRLRAYVVLYSFLISERF